MEDYNLKFCSNCHQDINRAVENSEEKFKMGLTLEMGKSIYYALLDHRIKSIDLCNWCYSVMKAYRYRQESTQDDIKHKLNMILFGIVTFRQSEWEKLEDEEQGIMRNDGGPTKSVFSFIDRLEREIKEIVNS